MTKLTWGESPDSSKAIAIVLPNEAERQGLLAALGRSSRVLLMPSAHHLASAITPHVRAIVCATGCGLGKEPRLLSALSAQGIRLVMRAAPTPDAIDEIVAVSSVGSSPRVIMRPREQSAAAVNDILARLNGDDDCGPIGVLAARHASRLHDLAGVHVVAAVVASRERASIHDYSRLIGCASRTLQLAHVRLRIAPPLRMLRWARALWLAWRIEVRGLALKQAQQESGDSTASLASAVRTIMNMTPKSLARHAAFDLVCSRLPDLTSEVHDARSLANGH